MSTSRLARRAIVIASLALSRADSQATPGRREERADRIHLSGYVGNRRSLERVRHATVFADSGVAVAGSNEEGFYSLTLTTGRHALHVRAIGYAPFDTTLTLLASTVLNVLLDARALGLPAVSVQASSIDPPNLNPRNPDPGVVRLDLATIRLTPVILGEHDVLRALTLLPGVTTANDATTSLNVRGGGADQNLVLLDDAPLYNPTHILGFLSTFNTDALDEVTVYKGSIPVRYGGRLSSVVDIRQREGNANAFGGTASIGLLSSRLLLEGPLPRKEGSFMIAARRSYADLFLRASSDSTVRDKVAYFYDVNAKATLHAGPTGSLVASAYRGRDRYASDSLDVTWGNAVGTLRWNQAIGGALFSKVTAITSSYDYHLGFPVVSTPVSWIAGIGSLALKADETLHLADRDVLEFGAEVASETFRPGKVATTTGPSAVSGREVEARHAVTAASYVGQDIDLGAISVRYGVRLSVFSRRGPATTLRYANDAPLIWNDTLGTYQQGRVVDSVVIGAGATMHTFAGAEPRLAVRFGLGTTASVKASYMRTRQYVQLAMRTTSPTPLDVWEPAGPFIRPQTADQVSFGYTKLAGVLEFSAETYFKRLYGVIDFVDGADIILRDRLETALVQGEGRDYGFELFARRRAGRLTGWISYTLSRAEQRFPAPSLGGAPRSGGINDGRYYPSPFDKTHNLSAVAAITMNRRWTFGSIFVLASGLPATYPESRYLVYGRIIAEYGPRNQHRLPMYHRLDLSATRATGRGTLELGVFNVYGRFNAQRIDFRQSDVGMTPEAVEVAMFRVVPSVSYTWHF